MDLFYRVRSGLFGGFMGIKRKGWKVKEFICQMNSTGLRFSSLEDKETAQSEYKLNQMVRVQTYNVGLKKEPSIIQNNLMHACFGLVAENSHRFKSKEQVKFAFKVDIHFVYEDRVAIKKDGTVMFEYRSFNFKALPHMERCNVFERAFEWCADILGITKQQLIAEAKAKMLSF